MFRRLSIKGVANALKSTRTGYATHRACIPGESTQREIYGRCSPTTPVHSSSSSTQTSRRQYCWTFPGLDTPQQKYIDVERGGDVGATSSRTLSKTYMSHAVVGYSYVVLLIRMYDMNIMYIPSAAFLFVECGVINIELSLKFSPGGWYLTRSPDPSQLRGTRYNTKYGVFRYIHTPYNICTGKHGCGVGLKVQMPYVSYYTYTSC